MLVLNAKPKAYKYQRCKNIFLERRHYSFEILKGVMLKNRCSYDVISMKQFLTQTFKFPTCKDVSTTSF